VIAPSGEFSLQKAMDLSQEGLTVFDEGVGKPKACDFNFINRLEKNFGRARNRKKF